MHLLLRANLQLSLEQRQSPCTRQIECSQIRFGACRCGLSLHCQSRISANIHWSEGMFFRSLPPP